MSSYEERAYDRSEPGSGPTPVYEGPSRDVVGGWRINTPPIALEVDEEDDE